MKGKVIVSTEAVDRGGGGTGIEGAGSGGGGGGKWGKRGREAGVEGAGRRGIGGREVCSDMGKKLLLFDKKLIENCPKRYH